MQAAENGHADLCGCRIRTRGICEVRGQPQKQKQRLNTLELIGFLALQKGATAEVLKNQYCGTISQVACLCYEAAARQLQIKWYCAHMQEALARMEESRLVDTELLHSRKWCLLEETANNLMSLIDNASSEGIPLQMLISRPTYEEAEYRFKVLDMMVRLSMCISLDI